MTDDDVEYHVRLHLNQTVAKCYSCPQTTFSSMNHFKEHKNIHTEAESFGCSYCKVVFTSSGSLVAHMENTHPDISLEEERKKAVEEKLLRLRKKKKLNKKLRKKEQWEEERKTNNFPPPVLSKKPIVCEKCKATFHNNVDYAIHSMIHSEDGVFQCFLCDSAKKRDLHDIEKHIRLHEGTYVPAATDPKVYQCEICGNKFKKYTTLYGHIKCHDTKRRTYDCTLCDKKLFIDPSMIEEEHNNDVECQEVLPATVSRWCEICETKFFNDVKYALHTLTHSKNGIFKCFLCPVEEKMTDDRVEQHIRRHLNQTVAKCYFCPETKFYSMKHYTEHRNVHTGIKPFGCSYCELAFVFSVSLKTHMEIQHHDVILEEERRKADEEKSLRLKKEEDMKKEINYLDRKKRWEETRRKMPPPLPSKDPIICEKCKATFNNKVDYAVHLMRHSEDGVFECFLCDSAKKRNLHDIEKHIRLHEGTYVPDKASKIYQCGICGSKFEKSNALQNHMKCHDSNRATYDCQLCDKKYYIDPLTIKEEYNIDIEQEEEESETESRSCEICEMKFNDVDYALHTLTHSKNGTFKCFLCPVEAKMTEDNIEYHIRLHLKQSVARCAFCPKINFYSMKHFREHENVHTGAKPFSCNYCKVAFTFSGSLKAHIENTHQDVLLEEERKIANEERLSRLRKKRNSNKEEYQLRRKKQWEEERKKFPPPVPSKEPIVCEKCEAIFHNNVDYAIHIMDHSEDGFFECFLCSSVTKRTLPNVEKHVRLHEGTWGYLCKICGTTVKSLNLLKVHIKSHQKTYNCTECEKKYLMEYNLVIHKAKHHASVKSRGRPYKCKFCDKCFKQRVSKTSHERRLHSGDEPYKCGGCKECFSSKAEKDAHVNECEGF
ncbi:unnamed protein product [Phaedon cochleariae]|uniref:C2H2-type domain-containing protein n=1 Tax=Phaedon cochleariae TaxID=80249 RepID=A0A9P0DJ06_PHACE|nr:unnamed protein product [Phaedon cochleariae]